MTTEEAVAAERARCLWWVRAYAAYPASNPAGLAIAEGRPVPNDQPDRPRATAYRDDHDYAGRARKG